MAILCTVNLIQNLEGQRGNSRFIAREWRGGCGVGVGADPGPPFGHKCRMTVNWIMYEIYRVRELKSFTGTES